MRYILEKILGAVANSLLVVDERDRLKRPWAVVVFAILLSAAGVGLITLRSHAWAASPLGLLGAAVWAAVLGCVYAFIGRCWSRNLAGRVVGPLVLLSVFAAVGFIVYGIQSGGNAMDEMFRDSQSFRAVPHRPIEAQ
jgi:hypothetical protein